MTEQRKNAIRRLLKGIETGDPTAVAVVDESKYIQHNPQTQEGSEGLAQLFARLSKSKPRVNVVRAFSDGDFVFGHTEYDFSSRRIGFEVFRFERDRAVEHWDNIQPRNGPSPSGHSMVDGPTEAVDLEYTEENRRLVRNLLEDVFLEGRPERLRAYVGAEELTQHSPEVADGVDSWIASLKLVLGSAPRIEYETIHRVLAEGDFVLSVCEGRLEGSHASFYDLFRIVEGKVVEHWDTVEKVAPRSEWKNTNGKF